MSSERHRREHCGSKGSCRADLPDWLNKCFCQHSFHTCGPGRCKVSRTPCCVKKLMEGSGNVCNNIVLTAAVVTNRLTLCEVWTDKTCWPSHACMVIIMTENKLVCLACACENEMMLCEC